MNTRSVFQVHSFSFRLDKSIWTQDEVEQWCKTFTPYYVFTSKTGLQQDGETPYFYWEGEWWLRKKRRRNTLMKKFFFCKKIDSFEVLAPADAQGIKLADPTMVRFVDQVAEQKNEGEVEKKTFAIEVNLQPIGPTFSESLSQENEIKLPVQKSEDAQDKKESVLPPKQTPSSVALTNLKAAPKRRVHLIKREETGFQSDYSDPQILTEELKKSPLFKDFSMEELTDLRERFEVSKIREKHEASRMKPDSRKKDDEFSAKKFLAENSFILCS